MLWTLLVLAAMFRSTVGKPAVYAADGTSLFIAKHVLQSDAIEKEDSVCKVPVAFYLCCVFPKKLDKAIWIFACNYTRNKYQH